MSNPTIVLITGANSGVGYATAHAIASLPNHHVIMGVRSAAKGEAARAKLEAASSLQGTLSVQQLDVEDDASIAAAVSAVSKKYRHLDAFISNAGTTAQAAQSARDTLTQIFSTNVFGAMLASEAFIPLLLRSEKRPCLVQVSSGLGSLALAADPQSAYAAARWDEYRMSKAALNMLTLQMHKRLAEKNVRVFAFCPGLVRSQLRGDSEEAVSAGGRAGDPMESAAAIIDIISGQRDADVGKFVHKGGCHPW